jgi:hypothetical protein
MLQLVRAKIQLSCWIAQQQAVEWSTGIWRQRGAADEADGARMRWEIACL